MTWPRSKADRELLAWIKRGIAECERVRQREADDIAREIVDYIVSAQEVAAERSTVNLQEIICKTPRS